MSRTRIDLCGRLLVEIDGGTVEGAARGRQGRLLLAFLVLHRQTPVSRERLVEALWGGALPRDPSAVLNTLLSGLRRALGDGRLEGRRELRIDLGPDAEVDVEVALAARNAALDALSRGAFEEAAASARTAAEISARELLPGDDADWLDRARDELREVHADALESLARAGIELGEADALDAVRAASAVVAFAPFRESAYALLMEAHAARGNVAEALRVFDDLRGLLREELGTAPSPPLLALHRRLVALDQHLEADQLPLPPPLVDGETGFVGREAALARLRAAHVSAAAGARRFVVAAGEAGIGKTSLATRFAHEAHADGSAVLYGRCSEEPLLPYEPFVGALCQYIGTSAPAALEPDANPELEELGRWMPDLGRPVAEQAGPLPLEPDTQRFRMFEAMVALLARVARDRPLLFVIDDLHWADGSTVRLIRYLALAARPRRLLVLATYRDAEPDASPEAAALLADLRRDVDFERLTLEGLDEAETAAMVAARGATLARRHVERLRAITAGHPLFLEETLRAIAARPSGGGDPLADLGVPEAVAEMIRRRLARMSPASSEVLATAAVLGMSFRLSVLEQIAAPGTPVLGLLEEACAARLVVELPEPERFAFSHALVREALYGLASRSRRLRIHLQAAELLEARAGELGVRAAELEEHFFAARQVGGGERALHYATEAGDHATASLAYEEAARHYERALAVLELLPEPDDLRRCDLLLALGEAQMRAGRPAARATFARAAEAARGRCAHRLATAAMGFAGRYQEAGVVEQELIDLLEESAAALDEADTALRARVLGRLGEALHFAGGTERALELTAAAVAMGRRLGDPMALIGALAGRHVALLYVGHLDERLAVSAELRDLARRLDRPELCISAHHARLYDLFELGDVAEARKEHDSLRRLSADLRQPLFRHFALSWAAVRAQIEGRFDDAERLAAELLELQTELGARDADTVFAARLFAVRRDQGRLGELLPAVDAIAERFPGFAPLRAGVPLIYLGAGDVERARAALGSLAPDLPGLPRDFFWLTTVALAAEAAAALGDRRLCRGLHRMLTPFAERTVQIGFAATLGSVERLLGLTAAGAGDAADARAHFERALVRNGALASRPLTIRTQSEFAEFLFAAGRSGDRARAADLAATALAGAGQLGMAAVAERLAPHATVG